MRLQFDPERPIYQQIIDEFKRAVARGELAPGDKIPSQRDVATEARVNPNTVQRAYREMEWLGLTETVRGQGTFVAHRPELLQGLRQEMAQNALDRFVKEMAALGFDGETIVGLTVEAVRSLNDAPGVERAEQIEGGTGATGATGAIGESGAAGIEGETGAIGEDGGAAENSGVDGSGGSGRDSGGGVGGGGGDAGRGGHGGRGETTGGGANA